MSRQQRTDRENWLNGLSLIGIVLHPAMLCLVATGVTVAAAIYLWGLHQEQIVNNGDFLLSENHFHVSSPEPEWAQENLPKLVYQQFSKQPSLMDTELVTTTAHALRNVGWVQNVQRIQKSRTGVDISVVYRSPVAIVQLPGRNSVPVDSDGVVMPENVLSAIENPDALLRISVWKPQSSIVTWGMWPDIRIQDAAALSGWIRNNAKDIGLFRVVSEQRPESDAEPQPLEIWTRFGKGNRPNAKVRWGSPIGKESVGEATPTEKLKALRKYIQENGPLEGQMHNGIINLTDGVAKLESDDRMANQKILFKDIK